MGTSGRICGTISCSTPRHASSTNRTKSRKSKSRDSWNLYLCQQGLEKVSLDFITHLPKVREYDAILVIVDRFSKYAMFVPTPKLFSTELTAQLFFKNVVKLWGILSNIISDRDGRFISTFWSELFAFLGMTLNIFSSYHRQTDGQILRFNCLLEEYLRHFVDAR